jgi:hypothetical protein
LENFKITGCKDLPLGAHGVIALIGRVERVGVEVLFSAEEEGKEDGREREKEKTSQMPHERLRKDESLGPEKENTSAGIGKRGDVELRIRSVQLVPLAVPAVFIRIVSIRSSFEHGFFF